MKKELRILLCVFAGGLFAASCFWLYGMMSGYRAGEHEYNELYGKYVVSTAAAVAKQAEETLTESRENTENLSLLLVDFDKLLQENSDTVAWIDFPGLAISYPVVQGLDNETYLKRTFQGGSNASGCIFMDVRSQKDFGGENTIIYGHNMKNGSMFGLLKKYRNQDFYEEYPNFYIYMAEETFRCEIVSSYTIKADLSEYPVSFADEEYALYQKKILERSAYDTGRSLNPEDKLIMLSTCTGSTQERFVVQARAVVCGR